MAKSVFGLDIGTSLIKAVGIETRKEGKVLTKVAIRPAPPKGLRSEAQMDLDAVSTTIKDLWHEAQIGTKFVNAALPESQVFTRVIDIPNLSDKELSSAIHWEAEQYVPSPLSEVALDYQIIQRPQSPTDPMQILLVAAPLALINKYRKVLEEADLIPFVFETETLSIVRAIITGRETDTLLLVNLGAAQTALSIIRKGVLVFTYTVSIGGYSITRSIATELGFDLAQAEEYKKTYGLSEDLQGKIAISMAPIIKSITSEIEKGIKYFQEKYSDERITRVLIAGGGAKLPGIVPFLAQSLDMEVEIANPWTNIIVDQTIFQDALRDAPLFTTATGLALRDYE